MPRNKCWECHWKERAYHNAQMSTCLRRHVGGILVRGNRVVADGFNGNLPGRQHCDEGGCDRCNDPSVPSGEGMDRCSCVHAEQNIIAYCAKNGVNADGTTLYNTHKPCIDCMKLLVSSGVVEVVWEKDYPSPDWMARDYARSYVCECGYVC